MDDATYRTAADFIYVSRDGRPYRVRGEKAGPLGGRRAWQSFCVRARPSEVQGGSTANVYWTTEDMKEYLSCRADVDEAGFALRWFRALRRYALQHAVAELDAGGLSGKHYAISYDDRAALESLMQRVCDFQDSAAGDLFCGAVDPGTDRATTRTICEACTVPDQWERCANLSHIRTRPAVTQQGGIIRRECAALCQGGKHPDGAIPDACRAGSGQPACFEPRVLEAPPQSRAIGLRSLPAL